MVLAVAQDTRARAQFLKLGQDQRNDVANLRVWIFHDALIGEPHEPRGQTLHILTALDFTQASRV